MYRLALASARPRAITVRSAVATARVLCVGKARSGEREEPHGDARRREASGASPGNIPAPRVRYDLPGLGRAAVRARDRRRDVGLPDEATAARVLRAVVRTPRSAKAPLVGQVVLALRSGLGLRHRGGGRLAPEEGPTTRRATAVARFALSIGSDAHVVYL